MMDIVRSQIIEMIAIQACSVYGSTCHEAWSDMKIKPVFEEEWFWRHFRDMVDEAVMNLKGAVEGWVTVEYEVEIEDILESHSKSSHPRSKE